MKLRATTKIRNDRLIEARESKGLSQTDAAEFCGVSFSMFRKLETLQYPKIYPEEDVLRISVAFRIPPDDIMSADLAGKQFQTNLLKTIEVDNSELLLMENPKKFILESPEDKLLSQDLKMLLDKEIAKCLTYREKMALELYFGLNDEVSLTYIEISRILRVSLERARQLVTKAMAKLKRRSEIAGRAGETKLEDYCYSS